LTLRFRYMLDVVGHKPFQTLATQSPEDYRALKEGNSYKTEIHSKAQQTRAPALGQCY